MKNRIVSEPWATHRILDRKVKGWGNCYTIKYYLKDQYAIDKLKIEYLDPWM